MSSWGNDGKATGGRARAKFGNMRAVSIGEKIHYYDVSGNTDEVSLVECGRIRESNDDDVTFVTYAGSGGTTLLIAQGSRIHLIDANTGTRKAPPLLASTGTLNTLAVSTTGDLIACCGTDRAVRLFDLKTMSQVGNPLLGHSGAVVGSNFSTDFNSSLLVTCGSEAEIFLWDVQQHKARRGPVKISAKAEIVNDAVFSPDGRQIICGDSHGIVHFVDTNTMRLLASNEGHNDGVTTLHVIASGDCVVSGSFDGTIRMWSLASRKQVGVFTGHTGTIWNCWSTPDGATLMSASSDGFIRFWNVTDRSMRGQPVRPGVSGNQQQQQMAAAPRPLLHVAMGDDGRTIATASTDRGNVRLWNVEVGRYVGEVKYPIAVKALDFTNDGFELEVGDVLGQFRKIRTPLCPCCRRVSCCPAIVERARNSDNNSNSSSPASPVTPLQSQNPQQQQQLQQTEQQLQQTEQQLKEETKKRTDAEAAVVSLQTKLTAASTESTSEKTKREAAEKRIAELEAKLQEEHAAHEAAQKRLTDVDRELAVLRAQSPDYQFKAPYEFDASASTAFVIAKAEHVIPVKALPMPPSSSSYISTSGVSSNARLVLGAPLPEFVKSMWQSGGLRQRNVFGFQIERWDALFQDNNSSDMIQILKMAERKLMFERATGMQEFHDDFSKLTVEQREEKKALIRLLKQKFCTPYRDVNYLYAAHGCPVEVVGSILAMGFIVRNSNDPGWFAQGAYFSLQIEEAARYACGELTTARRMPAPTTSPHWPPGCWPVIISAVGVSVAYPHTKSVDCLPNGKSVFHADQGAPGKALKPGCDCHVVPVSEADGFYCCEYKRADYVELVVRDSSLVVPMGVLWLKKTN